MGLLGVTYSQVSLFLGSEVLLWSSKPLFSGVRIRPTVNVWLTEKGDEGWLPPWSPCAGSSDAARD